jgi:hypothetical protein
MSIIFQLFNAEDLKKLSNDQLDRLRDTVRRMVNNPSTDDILKASLNNSDLLEKELGDSPPPDYASQVIDTLRKRASDIFRQLIPDPLPGQPSPQLPPFTDQASIFNQLLTRKDFSDLDDQLPVTGRKIVLWAIVCELANFKSYRTMEEIQLQARTEISPPTVYQGGQDEEERRFKDPDSAYSSFNPLSPVYYRNRP